MTTSEAVKFFKTGAALAAALKIRQPSIYGWGDFPPLLRQLQIEHLTKGKLKAEKIKAPTPSARQVADVKG